MVVGLLSNLSNNKYFKIDDSALNNYVDFITIFDVLEFFTKDNIPFIAKYLKDSDELHKLPSYIVNHSQKYDNKLIPKKIKGHKFDAFIDMLFEYDDFLTDYNFDLEEYRYNPKYTDNVLNLDDFLKLNCINKIGLDKKTFNQTLLELSEVHYAYFSFDEQTQLDQAHARIAELEQQLANAPNQATRSQKDEHISELESQTSELKGLALHNHNIAKAKAFAQIIAKSIWDMDENQQIKTGDMVRYIKVLLWKFDQKNLPQNDETLADWLKDVKPTYATKGGRPPKDAPNKITLTFKK